MPATTPATPLEIKDFAGGISDNIVLGATNRSQYLDNFFITNDHKIEERYAFLPIDNTNYLLPSGNQRVNSMFAFISESILMANSARHIYYLNPNWTEVTGIGGNEALSGGDINSQVGYAEFQKLIYLTSDGINGIRGIQPSKIYKNSTGVWTAKTAGLPRSYYQTGTYTNNGLLASCISLANALRTSMLSHMNDVGNVGNGGLHPALDTADIAILNAAPLATNQTSLFTLIGALNSAFATHTFDATKQGGFPTLVPSFHYSNANLALTGIPARGPHIQPTNNSTPTIVANPQDSDVTAALTTCAAQLDNLYTIFNFHRLSWFGHSINNDPAIFDRYKPTVGKIGRVNVGKTYPIITPDWTDFFTFCNTINSLLSYHLSGVLGRANTQNVLFKHLVNVPRATDLDSAFLLIYWMRAVYDYHIQDASFPIYTDLTISSTAATTGLQTITSSTVMQQGNWIYSSGGFVATDNSSSDVALVISASGTSVTIDRKTSSNLSSAASQMSASFYHGNFSSQGVLATATVSPVSTVEKLSTANTSIGSILTGNSNTQQYDINSWITLATELFYCLFAHSTQVVSHPNLGFIWSQQFIAGQLYGFYIPKAETAAYAFYYSDQYTVDTNGIQYLVQSNPVFSDSLQVTTSYPVGYQIPTQNSAVYPSTSVVTTRSNKISQLPVLANTNETNYDTSNVKLNIARTTDGGTTFYIAGFVNNGVTTYTDSVNDTISIQSNPALNTNALLYTSGGVVGNDQPPQAKYIEIVNNVVYYGSITDTGQDFPQRIRQALPFAPDHAPATFFDDMDEAITGLARARSNLVVFCQNSIYRESGGFNTVGQGALTHERISDTTGCLNYKSIVKTEIGIFFAGNDGFYYTDGFQIIKISLELDKTYKRLTSSTNQRRSITGAYDKITRRIWWSMKNSSTDTENNISYVFYLDFGVKPSGVFSTISNGIYQTQSGLNNYQPASVVFMNGTAYIGDGRGYILFSDQDNKSDAFIDTTQVAANWITRYIPFNWTTAAMDAGSVFMKKYLTRLHVVGKNVGNETIQVSAIRDMNFDSDGIKLMSIINYTDNMTWGDARVIWNNPAQDPKEVWNPQGKLDAWRRFPQTSLRADVFQLQFMPNKSAVYSVDGNYPTGSNAVVDATLKTATIQTPTGYSAILWPLDVVGMVIAFQTDKYTNEFTITALNAGATKITYSDPTNLSVTNSGGIKWVIRGYKKNQRAYISSAIIHYELTGDNNPSYPGATAGSGYGNANENNS